MIEDKETELDRMYELKLEIRKRHSAEMAEHNNKIKQIRHELWELKQNNGRKKQRKTTP